MAGEPLTARRTGMGTWRIVGAFAIGVALGAIWRLVRSRVLLLSGSDLLSLHLLLAAVLLGDAAVFPGDLPALAVPLGIALVGATASLCFRKLHLLTGPGAATAESNLEACGTEMGLDWVREGRRVIFKRQGAAMDRIGEIAGFRLLRLDRRRAEPAVDSLIARWRRSLSGGSGGRR